MTATIDPRVLNRLQGLLALTASDNKHEAQSAQAKLEALCAKHGVRLDDLCDVHEEKELHWFRYDNEMSKLILKQTGSRVLGDGAEYIYTNKGRQRQIGFECTASQAAELRLWWSVMRDAYKRHEEAAAIAFVHANKLYHPNPKKTDEPRRPMSDVERQALGMVDSINPTAVYKALNIRG